MRRALLLVALLAAPAALARPIPPAPMGENYLFDEAGLVGGAREAELRGLQTAALEQYNSPLVVVTISSISEYGGGSIESLARQWFDSWQIGTLGLQGGANQGILLLVAVNDRKARIELGADWGHDWDGYAQRVMSGTIVPAFKRGDFPGGIVEGAKELVEMAKQGPNSRPPGDFLESRVRPMCKYSLLDPTPFLVMMGIGLALVVLGVFWGGSMRGWLIGAGIALILFAAFTWAVLAILLLVFGRRGRGGGGGGRGFSGGFSGGGGATGSW